MYITFKSHHPAKGLVTSPLRYFSFGTARPALLLIVRTVVVLIPIILGFPKMMGFGGTVQYVVSLGAPTPMLAAIIVVAMKMPAVILTMLGFFTRLLAVPFILYILGTVVIGHRHRDMIGDVVGPNMTNFWKNVSIVDAFLLLAITGLGAISLDRH